jgi:hypothetical protein
MEVDKDVATYEQSLSLMAQVDQAFGRIDNEIGRIQGTDEQRSVREMMANYYNYCVGKFLRRGELLTELKANKNTSITDLNLFIN